MPVVIPAASSSRPHRHSRRTVTLPGQGPQRFKGLACGNPTFRRLDWWGFVSNADAPVVLYLDDVGLDIR